MEVLRNLTRIWAVGAKAAITEPGNRWESDNIHSYSAQFRSELLNREKFYSLREAQTIIES